MRKICLTMENPNSATSCRPTSYTPQTTGKVWTLCIEENPNSNSSVVKAVTFLLHRIRHPGSFLCPYQQRQNVLNRNYRCHTNNRTERDLCHSVAAE
jgi:hypothetical protein